MALPLIVDNDAILKLSACSLLDEAVSLIGSTFQDAIVLDAARHAFRKQRDRQRPKDIEKYTIAGLERAVRFAESATRLQSPPDPHIQDVLTGIPNIDPEGDLGLVARAYDLKDAVLLTGDKRCIRAIAANESIRFIYDSLATRVVCLEEVVRALIIHLGFVRVRAAIVPVMQCDTMLRVVFGSGMQASETAVLQALASYVTELERDTGNDWLRRIS